MIPYSRDPEKTIQPSSVKIIGLGGAGANMLERIALEGMEGTELLALNTDIRTLGTCIAKEKIQLGINLTKGLGAGGDPEIGHRAVLEAEAEIRASLKGRRIVFICAGLGGGTGSGAAPIVTRIAREEGAFVVVFATIPFAFEGKRRKEQAETSLNELAVLSNALVTFDNNRMGELVLAKQGIHEAFAAADHMISESIKAVIRLVVRPGLINVGLDDLMSALRSNRSRCLFGSGLASGKDRAAKALRNALASPLLDQGSLLKESQTVLVHLCGGEGLTLFEVELLMQRLQKFVPESAQVLFGAAVDPAMGDDLSITLISSLPEESLALTPRESISHAEADSPLLPRKTETVVAAPPAAVVSAAPTPPTATIEPPAVPAVAKATPGTPSLFEIEPPFAETTKAEHSPLTETTTQTSTAPEPEPELLEDPVADDTTDAEAEPATSTITFHTASTEDESDPDPSESIDEASALRKKLGFSQIPPKRPEGSVPWNPKSAPASPAPATEPATPAPTTEPAIATETPRLKLGVKSADKGQDELSLDSAPRGRFEGENPNVFEGEDLDLPPFLRKKK